MSELIQVIVSIAIGYFLAEAWRYFNPLKNGDKE
jgi:hypothetical protein